MDRAGRLTRHAMLILFTVMALLPVYVMISSSLRSQSDFLNHPLGLPTRSRLSAYQAAINNHIPRWLFNSLMLTTVSW